MIYEFRLPLIVKQMTGATVEYVHAKPGDAVKMGSKLIDLSVDLSSAFAQECPPISFFRVVLREAAWLRKFDVQPGQSIALNEVIAVFGSEPDEDISQPAARVIRTTVAGIVHHDAMWTGSATA
jgi:pyruvate/2-oxoglutarate dehydrogenase complex dihydrolipoamide acyltransferase (E2) component